MILSIILITIFILFISYFLVLYYYNNNKMVSLHAYKNENEIFSHGNSIVNNDIKYTKPIENVTTPPQPNTELINKQKLILDAIILNLNELNSLGAIDSSLTDKLNAIKRSSLLCVAPTFTNFNFDHSYNYLDIINKLTDLLPKKDLIRLINKLINLLPTSVSYDKDDLIPSINILISNLPDKEKTSYTIDELFTPIKNLISNLPIKTNTIHYNKNDLLRCITILITRLPDGVIYYKNDLILPINILISNLPDKATGTVDYDIIDLIPSIKKLIRNLPDSIPYNKNDLIPSIKILIRNLPNKVHSSISYDISDLITPIQKLIRNLPDKYGKIITYDKDDLIPSITLLTNKLPTPNKLEKFGYTLNELLSPINILVGIKNNINGDMINSSDATCFNDIFKSSVANVNTLYLDSGITLLNLADIEEGDYRTNIMQQIYGNYKHVCENV